MRIFYFFDKIYYGALILDTQKGEYFLFFALFNLDLD